MEINLSKEEIDVISKYPELKEIIEDISLRYQFEFDTQLNRNKLMSEISESLKPYTRDEK
jgi:hypothetical protein